MRRSWLTDMRNWRSSAFDRWRLSAIELIEATSSPTSSRPAAVPSGIRASRSPAAMRRATSRDARMGPVSDRLTRPATSAATTMVASEASKNQRNDGIRSGSGSSVITTSCRVPLLLTYPRAAQRRSPSRVLCVSPARSRSVSRSSTVRPSGRLPIGLRLRGNTRRPMPSTLRESARVWSRARMSRPVSLASGTIVSSVRSSLNDSTVSRRSASVSARALTAVSTVVPTPTSRSAATTIPTVAAVSRRLMSVPVQSRRYPTPQTVSSRSASPSFLRS